MNDDEMKKAIMRAVLSKQYETFSYHRHDSASSVADLVPGLPGAPGARYDPLSLLDIRLAKLPVLRYEIFLV